MVKLAAMGIPERLWGVLRDRGYESIEEMARRETLRLKREVKARTLYSWMTDDPRYHREPWKPESLRLVSLITDTSMAELLDSDGTPTAAA